MLRINHRISKLRKKSNLKLDVIGKGIVSPSHLSNIESGRYEPSNEILTLLADRYHVPDTYLVNYDECDLTQKKMIDEFEKDIFNDIEAAENVYHRIIEHYPYINSLFLETKFFLLTACYYLKLKVIDKAEYYYENEFLPLLGHFDLPEDLLYLQYYFLGGMHFYKQNYQESLQNYLKMAATCDYPSIVGIIHYNIGTAHFMLGNYKESIEHIKLAKEQYILDQKWKELGEAYNLLGSIYIKQDDLIVAKKYFDISLNLAKQYSYRTLEARNLHNIARIEFENNNIEHSTALVKESLAIKKEVSGQSVFISYELLFDIFYTSNQLDQANRIIKEIEETIELDTAENHVVSVFKCLIQLKQGDGQQFFTYVEKAFKYFYENKIWKYISKYGEDFAEYLFSNKKYKQSAQIYKLTLLAKNGGK